MSDDKNSLDRRMEILEAENARLRRHLVNFGIMPANPGFDGAAFRKAYTYYSLVGAIPFTLIVIAVTLVSARIIVLPQVMVGPIPLFGNGGTFTPNGIGVGIFAFGGVAIGAVAFGGFSAGIVACGGGAIGIIAIGGGAIGLVAYGGGAVGIIAMGGGAVGFYALCTNGAGKHVFSFQRQDDRAVEFWTRWLPRFRAAISAPMPVIPIDEVSTSSGQNSNSTGL